MRRRLPSSSHLVAAARQLRHNEAAVSRNEDTLPRYIDIRRAIEARIMSGALRPGDRIPGEVELMREFQVSRMTVNKALSSLGANGLLVRRRGSGSFVAAPKSQQTILEIHDIKVEVEAAGRRYRHEIVARDVRRAGAADRTALAIDGGGTVVALTVRHFADEEPFALEDRVINGTLVPEALAARFDEDPPGTWLLKRIPWTEAEHRIRAVAAPAKIAQLLRLPPRAACLLIERVTWQSGTPVTRVRLTYPGDRHELIARFSPTS